MLLFTEMGVYLGVKIYRVPNWACPSGNHSCKLLEIIRLRIGSFLELLPYKAFFVSLLRMPRLEQAAPFHGLPSFSSSWTVHLALCKTYDITRYSCTTEKQWVEWSSGWAAERRFWNVQINDMMVHFEIIIIHQDTPYTIINSAATNALGKFIPRWTILHRLETVHRRGPILKTRYSLLKNPNMVRLWENQSKSRAVNQQH